MATPNNYYALNVRYEKLRALAFKLVMSDACQWGEPETQAVFDLVGDMTQQEVEDALREANAMEA